MNRQRKAGRVSNRNSSLRGKQNIDQNDKSIHLNSYFEEFKGAGSNSEKYIETMKSPFEVFILNNVFEMSSAKQLETYVTKADFQLKSIDLFTLRQSNDLKSFDSDVQSDFHLIRQVFDTKIRQVVESVFKKPMNKELSIAVTKYINGDHLLCHDDKCGDRHVAFIYYVNSDWKTEYGGLFQMFAHDEQGRPSVIEKTITPKFNSLVCFEVGDYTHHQVSEVVASHPKARYAISGWFHSDAAQADVSTDQEQKMISPSSSLYLTPIVYSEIHDLSLLDKEPEFYLKGKVSKELRKKFSEEGTIIFDSFLVPDLHKDVSDDLKSDRIKWISEGPPNMRNVEVAEFKSENRNAGLVHEADALNAVLDVFQTTVFEGFLQQCIGLEINEGELDVEVEIEVNRWKHGCYTLAQSNDVLNDYSASFEVWLFFNTVDVKKKFDEDCGGFIYNASDLNVNEYVVPSDNALVIINRPPDKSPPFVKYINNKMGNGVYHSVRVRYYVNKDSVSSPAPKKAKRTKKNK